MAPDRPQRSERPGAAGSLLEFASLGRAPASLLSPRVGARAVTDVAEPPEQVATQRVDRVRRRRERRRRVARRVLALAAVAVVLVGAAAGVRWLLTSPRFAVQQIDVRGISRVTRDQVVAAAGIAPGANLLRLDPGPVVARVEAIPAVRHAEMVRELPNRVTIMVEERRPFTLVHGARLYWLDEDGRLLGDESQAVAPPVPVVSGLTEDEVRSLGTAPGPKARTAVALIRALLRSRSTLTDEISEIDMSRADGPVLYTVGGIEVRLGTEDWADRLGRLEGVLNQVAGKDASVSVVDLRFRDQVVLQKGG